MENLKNIYVGATRPQLLPFLVLKYSIERESSEDITVHNLNDLVKDKNIARGTPFSLQRLYIPELNNYEGVAIYLDSDMVVFSDISELFQPQETDETVIGCKSRDGCLREKQFSVFRIDCFKAKNWDFKKNELKNEHNTKLDFEKSKIHSLSSDWNSLEYYNIGKTKLLHYTDMDRQPWLSSSNDLKSIWYSMLKEAVISGAVTKETIKNEVKLGYVLPSLVRFTENREILTFTEKIKDAIYCPPHTVDRFFKNNNFINRSILGFILLIKRLFK
jgi:lipopolysaccharide biosynthesis glycosyltransferase